MVDPKDVSDEDITEMSKKSKEMYMEYYRLMQERSDELTDKLLEEHYINEKDSLAVLAKSISFISRISYMPLLILQGLKQGNLHNVGLAYVDYYRAAIFERMKLMRKHSDGTVTRIDLDEARGAE